MDLGVFGATNDEALHGLQKDLDAYYANNKKAHRIQGPLTLPRIKTSGDWPKLKAKAGSTRHIIRYCVTLCRQHNSDSVHDKRRLAIVTLLDKFYNIVETEGRYLSEKSKQELPILVQSFMGIYYQLSLEAVQMRLRRWKFAQNFHLFQHLCELQMVKFGNGRFYWTYSDEDLQRILKNIAVRNHSSTVAWMTLYRYAFWVLDYD